MGILIVCRDADFSENAIGKVEIPEVECDHVYDNDCDTTCNLCGAVRTVPHDLVHYDAVAPTDTEDGNKEYWHCTLCDKYWLDEALTQPTTKDGVVLLSISSYPVYDTSLKGLYDLGGTEEDSLANHATNGKTATFTGTYEADGASVKFTGKSNGNFLDTNLRIQPSNTVTTIVLFSVPTGHRTIFGCRSQSSPNAAGISVMNDMAIYCADGTSKPIDFHTAINSNNFSILAMQASAQDGVGVCKVWQYKNGSLVPCADTYEGVLDNIPGTVVTTWRVGGDKLSTTFADAYISLAAIHEGDITGGAEGVTVDDKLLEICRFVKAYGEQKGLTIE